MFFIKFLRPKHVLWTMLLLIFWCTLLIKFALIQMTRGCSDDSAVENAKETGNLHGQSIRLVELLSARVHLLTAPLRHCPWDRRQEPPEFAVKKQGQNFSASLSYRQYSSPSCSHSFSNAGTGILKPAMIGATRKGCAFIRDDEKDSRMERNLISAYFF